MRTPDGTAFEISAAALPGTAALNLASLALVSGGFDTARSFPSPRLEQGRLVTRTPLPGFEGTEFIRGLMVEGARLELIDAAGRSLALSLLGPVPHSVRASYLACAGDLVGPGEEQH